MGKRWDLVVSTKKGERYNNTKVGVVFENDNGSLNIVVDKGISISSPDGTYLNAYIPRPRDESGGGF